MLGILGRERDGAHNNNRAKTLARGIDPLDVTHATVRKEVARSDRAVELIANGFLAQTPIRRDSDVHD